MQRRALAVLVLVFALAFPAAAYDRGDVLLKIRTVLPPAATTSFSTLVYHLGWPNAAGAGFILTDQTGPAELEALFTRGKGAPLRGGRLVTAEQLPGARFVEALANDCTVLYSSGSDARVRRLNICSGVIETDFASLPAGAVAGAIRQLPGGDVLVAGGSAVFQFTSNGALLRSYPMNGVTHVALTPDGAAFWAAGVDGASGAFLRYVDPQATGSESIRLGNAQTQTIEVDEAITDLVTVGEWRASAVPIRSRATRR